jgi:hypothetical protein
MRNKKRTGLQGSRVRGCRMDWLGRAGAYPAGVSRSIAVVWDDLAVLLAGLLARLVLERTGDRRNSDLAVALVEFGALAFFVPLVSRLLYVHSHFLPNLISRLLCSPNGAKLGSNSSALVTIARKHGVGTDFSSASCSYGKPFVKASPQSRL